MLDWCKEFNNKSVTLWVFSTENFNRPKPELETIFDLFEKKFKQLLNKKGIFEDKVKINVIGRKDLFPKPVQKAMNDVIKATKNHDKFLVNFAMGYGGKQELIDVAKKLMILAKAGKLAPSDLNEEVFSEHIYLVGLPKPDLIIRTGGVQRTSGFMAWSGDYAEWYFSDKLWPQFDKQDFVRALADYSERQRRFGR